MNYWVRRRKLYTGMVELSVVEDKISATGEESLVTEEHQILLTADPRSLQPLQKLVPISSLPDGIWTYLSLDVKDGELLYAVDGVPQGTTNVESQPHIPL